MDNHKSKGRILFFWLIQLYTFTNKILWPILNGHVFSYFVYILLGLYVNNLRITKKKFRILILPRWMMTYGTLLFVFQDRILWKRELLFKKWAEDQILKCHSIDYPQGILLWVNLTSTCLCRLANIWVSG